MRSFSPTFAGDSLSALRVARLLQQNDGTCVWQLWLSHKHTQTIHSRNRQKFTLTIPVEKVALVSATCPQRPSLSRVRPSLSRVHSSLSRVRSSLRRRLPYRGGVRAVGRHALPHAALTNTGPPDHTITPPSLSHTHGHMQASLRTAALTSSLLAHPSTSSSNLSPPCSGVARLCPSHRRRFLAQIHRGRYGQRRPIGKHRHKPCCDGDKAGARACTPGKGNARTNATAERYEHYLSVLTRTNGPIFFGQCMFAIENLCLSCSAHPEIAPSSFEHC